MWPMAALSFESKKETIVVKMSQARGQWLAGFLAAVAHKYDQLPTFQEVQAHYEAAGLEDFELFWEATPMRKVRELGLLAV